MDFNKLTVKARAALSAALSSAQQSGHPELYADHVLLAQPKFGLTDDAFSSLDFGDELRVHSIDLMRSHLSRQGARYSVVASTRLGAA